MGGVLNMQRDVMRNVYRPHPTRTRRTPFLVRDRTRTNVF